VTNNALRLKLRKLYSKDINDSYSSFALLSQISYDVAQMGNQTKAGASVACTSDTLNEAVSTSQHKAWNDTKLTNNGYGRKQLWPIL
jgi:hypothetical protein